MKQEKTMKQQLAASQIHSTPSLQGSEGNRRLTECQSTLSGRSVTPTRRAARRGGGPVPILKVSDTLMEALMRFEGLELRAYRDAGGVLTIGYGHTKEVQKGDVITEYWARELLKEDVEKVTRQVLKLGVCHTQGQLDALVSFTFNLGINRLRSSTLLKVIRKGGSAHQISKEFKRWVYCNGKKMRGLEIRREWEAERWEAPL